MICNWKLYHRKTESCFTFIEEFFNQAIKIYFLAATGKTDKGV